jgi:hypothetical protein
MGRLGFAGVAFKTCNTFRPAGSSRTECESQPGVLGPFVSLAECERAIRDHRQRIIPKVPD